MVKRCKSVILRILCVICAAVLVVSIPLVFVYSSRPASAKVAVSDVPVIAGVATSADSMKDFSYELEFSYTDFFLFSYPNATVSLRSLPFGTFYFKVHLDFVSEGHGYSVQSKYFIKYYQYYYIYGSANTGRYSLTSFRPGTVSSVTPSFDDYTEVVFSSDSSSSFSTGTFEMGSNAPTSTVFFSNVPISLSGSFQPAGVFSYLYAYSFNSLRPPTLTDPFTKYNYLSYVRITPTLFSSSGAFLSLNAITIPVPYNTNNNYFPYQVPNRTDITSDGMQYVNSALLNGGEYSKGFTNGYDEGYNVGYSVGHSDGSDLGYLDGYDDGYSDGFSDGNTTGFSAGVASANEYTFLGLMGAVIDTPIKAITSLLDFEVLGFNMSTFALSLLTICIILKIVSLISGG